MARHPADVLSLAFGLLAVALGLVLLTGGVSQLAMEWVGPAVAIGLGVLILIATWPRREPSNEESSPILD